MEVIDWNPEGDAILKKKELTLHEHLHEKKASSTPDEKALFGGKRGFRIGALNKGLQRLGVESLGRVLEIGAGDGWCSAYILKHYHVDMIYILETTRASVESLIPATLAAVGAPVERAKLVRGSFNDIHLESSVDLVVAMGALHHSSNLYHTFTEVYKCLKPGGWLIAQEPFMSDEAPNEYYFSREDKEINFWDIERIRNYERTDLFYRECEYKTAAFHAGLQPSFLDLSEPEKKKGFVWRKKAVKDAAKGISSPKEGLLLAQKPTVYIDRRPVTSWERISLSATTQDEKNT